MKFPIDECLSPTLADLAVAAGHLESAHVARRGMSGWKDHHLMRAAIDDDWTLVTRNSDDFRPRPGSSSQVPCYVGQPLHAGIVCLNLPTGSARADQQIYFQATLEYLGNPGDLVNHILEVDPDDENSGQIVLRKYDFPQSDA